MRVWVCPFANEAPFTTVVVGLMRMRNLCRPVLLQPAAREERGKRRTLIQLPVHGE